MNYKNSKSHVFWVTGLSGSGKTTFAKILQRLLNLNNLPNIIIDGDVIREIIGKESSYTKESRIKIAYIYSNLANMIQKQNINVICSTISLFHEVHDYNKENIKNYKEILISRSLDEIKKEDIKKIYESKDEVVGIDIIAEFPKNPDFLINNVEKVYLEDEAKKIIKKVLNLEGE